MNNLTNMNCKELRNIAANMNIAGRSKMRKDELVQAITAELQKPAQAAQNRRTLTNKYNRKLRMANRSQAL